MQIKHKEKESGMTVLSCGCTPDASGFGWCRDCVRRLDAKVVRNMSPERIAYDDHVDPLRAYH